MTCSAFYAWSREGGESQQVREDRRLLRLIEEKYYEMGAVLGYRRMSLWLRKACGEQVGSRRVRRLMSEASLWGTPRRKRKRYRRLARNDDGIPDLVQRHFVAEHPNQVWVTDLTEIRTDEGKLYLCIIKDLYDGVVVSWKTGVHQTAELITATVDRAVAARLESERPILHSDHGRQYFSQRYRTCLEEYGLSMSINQIITTADNASAESVLVN